MNKTNMKYLFIASVIFIASGFSYAEELKMQQYVAHGGGAVDGVTSTNSLEALERNYETGFRFFEMDFEWTSDNQLVLIHDWKESFNRLFGKEPYVYSLKGFKFLKMKNGFTQMELNDLANWLINHRDAYIITDIKSDNIRGLAVISEKYPDFKRQFIPQIYRYEEYDTVKDMRFKNIILALYVANYSDNEVIDFLSNHRVSALTIGYYRANKDFIDKLKGLGIFVYVHTVNDASLRDKLKNIKVDGFYTDYINPSGKK